SRANRNSQGNLCLHQCIPAQCHYCWFVSIGSALGNALAYLQPASAGRNFPFRHETISLPRGSLPILTPTIPGLNPNLRGSLMRYLLCALLLAAAPFVGRAEPDINDTKLLTQPAVSANNIAFVYAEDLWIADLDGRNPRRLTSDLGVESHPAFSP